jgi:hypothetical protein
MKINFLKFASVVLTCSSLQPWVTTQLEKPSSITASMPTHPGAIKKSVAFGAPTRPGPTEKSVAFGAPAHPGPIEKTAAFGAPVHLVIAQKAV